jgi:hypothetical protein
LGLISELDHGSETFWLSAETFRINSKHSLLWRCLMSDSILRLQSAGADVVIKTHPFAEIIYWGPHLSHFSPQDAASLTRPVANGRLDVDSPSPDGRAGPRAVWRAGD